MIRRLASIGITAAYVAWSHWVDRGPDRCVVLYYHGVTKRQLPGFERQMRWLASNTSIIPLQTLERGDWSGQRICLTFDDALDSVRQHALPVLRELNLPATIFAVAGNLGREPSWAIADKHPDRNEILSTAEQLKDYPSDLIEIGSHTMTHPDLTTLTGDSLRDELAESKRALETLLGREVRSLSVPFGAYNQESLRAAREVGYKTVVTCDPEIALRDAPQFRVGRFKVTPDDWDIEFRWKAAGAHQWRGTWQKLKGPNARDTATANCGPATKAKLAE